MKKVWITGLGTVNPLGINTKSTWNSLLKKESGIKRLTSEEFDNLSVKIAATTKFNHQSSLPKYIELTFQAVEEALSNANYDPNCDNQLKEEIGVCIGSGMSTLDQVIQTYNTFVEKGPKRISPFFVPRILSNMAAGHVSIKYGFMGPNQCPSTACAAGAHAIGDAFRLIKYGYAKMMIAGAVETPITPLGLTGFSQAKALTTKWNDFPQEASRPFDKDRDGFVVGEGAAILILEEMEHAIKRNVEPLAEIVGYGCSADAYHITASHPDGKGALISMQKALKEANEINPGKKVAYINAHATSTKIGKNALIIIVGDSAEVNAIKQLFIDQRIKVSSTKGATGHLLGAAGALEAIFSVLTLVHVIIMIYLLIFSF